MQVEPDTVLIPYEPGSKSGCVTVALYFGIHNFSLSYALFAKLFNIAIFGCIIILFQIIQLI
jgi:hypothetical protein